jgi:translation initiation factor 4E
MAAQASPSTEVAIPEDEHKLQTPWCFWYDLKKLHKAKAAEYAASLQKVCTCHSVEDFWRAYAHMTRPSKLETNCNLFLFRAGAGNKPMWESYPRGGCWILKIKKTSDVLSTMWQDLLFAAIGEIFEEPGMVGVSIARRKAIDMLSIWNEDSTNPEVHFGIGEKMKEVLDLGPDTMVEYKLFNDALHDGSTFRNARAFVFAPVS